MAHKEIIVDSPKEKELREVLKKRDDAEAKRMTRYLEMPDLSRTPGSPLQEIASRVGEVPVLKDFDIIKIPEIVPVDVLFDLFDFPADHPARSKSDTYYADDTNVLRTHDTVFWYYYLNNPEVKGKIERGDSLGTLCFGKVYRKDEIDRRHMNVFHQMGGWYLQPDSKGTLKLEDLKEVLIQIVKTVFGDVEYRFPDETFPYTDPSTEVEVNINGEWIEILGSGMVKKSVLKKMGVEGYNGWAFGFGLERLAIISMELPDIRLLWSDDERVKRQLKLGVKFQEVSKFPPITRDISFVVDKSFEPNNYFDLIRDIGGDLVEEVSLMDKYENEEKFGKDKVSYTYRVIYRSIDRTLTNEEITPFQEKIVNETINQFGADVR